MMTRRTLIESAAALLLANAAAAQPANSRNRQVFQHDLPKVALDNWAVTAVEVVYGPGDVRGTVHDGDRTSGHGRTAGELTRL